MNSVSVSFDGVSKINQSIASGATTIYSAYLFCANSGGSKKNCGQGRLYHAKIYNSSNELVRDYIPVLDQSNRPCLFDKVSRTCFYNQGTGELQYG